MRVRGVCVFVGCKVSRNRKWESLIPHCNTQCITACKRPSKLDRETEGCVWWVWIWACPGQPRTAQDRPRTSPGWANRPKGKTADMKRDASNP